MPVHCTRIRLFGICILFISLCLLRSSTLSFLDVLKVFKAMLSGIQEKLPFRYQQTYRDWRTLDAVSTNCGCPSITLESL